MRFLITGASGFIGKRLTEALFEKYGKGNEFVLVYNNKKVEIPRQYQNLKITQKKGDITDIQSLEDAFVGVDYVFHLAALLKYGNIPEEDFLKINQRGTENIFKLCEKNQVKKVIYMSSAGIFHPTGSLVVNEKNKIKGAHHQTKYTKTKYLAHKVADKYVKKGVPILKILPVSVFGENSPMFKPMIDQVNFKFIFIPKRHGRLSLLYVEDLVDGVIKVFEKGKIGEDYIFSGVDLDLEEIYRKIGQAMNKKPVFFRLPETFFVFFLKISDTLSDLLGKNLFMNREIFNYVFGGLIADHAKAIEELGHRETDFDKNFNKMVQSFNKKQK